MGLVIYIFLVIFGVYMAAVMCAYVIRTGDLLPLAVPFLLVSIVLYCLKRIVKAIRDKDFDIMD